MNTPRSTSAPSAARSWTTRSRVRRLSSGMSVAASVAAAEPSPGSVTRGHLSSDERRPRSAPTPPSPTGLLMFIIVRFGDGGRLVRTGVRAMDYRVISTDNHINEPPGTYVDRVPKALRDKAPRILRCPDGGDGWSYDGKPPKTTFGLGAVGAITEQNFKSYRPNGIKFDELLPGNYDGAEHIKDNARDGVDAATIYPAAVSGAYALADRELALACVRAYNDWLIEDFCSADPRRLLSLAFMPVNDGIPTAVAEAERVIAKGAKGLFLPLPDEVGYHDAMYDPLWKLAADAQVP